MHLKGWKDTSRNCGDTQFAKAQSRENQLQRRQQISKQGTEGPFKPPSWRRANEVERACATTEMGEAAERP